MAISYAISMPWCDRYPMQSPCLVHGHTLCNFYAWCMAIPYAISMSWCDGYPMQFPCLVHGHTLCNFHALVRWISYAISMPWCDGYPMQSPCLVHGHILCNFYALVRYMEPRLGDVLAFGSISLVDIEHRVDSEPRHRTSTRRSVYVEEQKLLLVSSYSYVYLAEASCIV